MGMKVGGPQCVKQRLFNNLVREQKRSTRTVFSSQLNSSRKVPVNKNGFAIDAITGDVRDIIIVADPPYPTARALTTSRSTGSSMSSDLWRSSFCRFIAGSPRRLGGQARCGYSSEP